MTVGFAPSRTALRAFVALSQIRVASIGSYSDCMNERMSNQHPSPYAPVKPRSAVMKIREISPILFAGAASLWMAASAGAAPLQQDLSPPLRPRPTPDDPSEQRGQTPDDPSSPGRIPTITPGNGLPIQPFRPLQDLAPQSDQRVTVNDEFAGWESASAETSGSRIEDTLRGNWIMVDANGRFDGQVIAGKNADTTNMNVFLMHMGRLVKQTTVDKDGQFVFNNVRQGAYALTGWGERGMFTFGVNILANNPNLTKTTPPNSVTVAAYQNQSTINTDWITHYAPQVGFRVFGKYAEGEGAKNDPALYGSIGLHNNPPENSPATSISNHVVGRTSNGHIAGRIHQFNSISGRPVDLRSTKVLLLENDSVVAATAADNYGVFEFEQVPAGSYGVLAAGVDGVGLIGITVADESDETNTIDFSLIPTETVGWLNSYAAEVAYRRNIAAPRPPSSSTDQQGGCQHCNNQAGGCDHCRREYLESACRQQGITFEQWQALGCQAVANKIGEGHLVREIGKALRGGIDRLDTFSENTFYPNSDSDRILRELGPIGAGGTQGQFQNGFSPAPAIPSGGSSTRGFGAPSGSSTRSSGGSSSR